MSHESKPVLDPVESASSPIRTVCSVAKPVESRSSDDKEESMLSVLFDPQYDKRFEDIISVVEALFQTMGVKISFPEGDVLRTRASNMGKCEDVPLRATLCGMAVHKGVPLEFSNAQISPEANTCPAVQRSGVSFYSNRLIRIQGGQIVGTLCIFDMEPRELTDKERELLDSLGHLTGQMVQGILSSSSSGGQSSRQSGSNHQISSFSKLDFTSLFELSPVPTAVLSYPDWQYVAANDPMVRGVGLPLERIIAEESEISDFELQDSRPVKGDYWLSEFRRTLQQNGKVEELEMAFDQPDGTQRILLVDGRFVQLDGSQHVLITGRDITDERERDRSLKLLLAGTNLRLGDDWFRSAASAFAELMDSELVVIAERTDPTAREFLTHAVLLRGEFQENMAFRIADGQQCPLLEGKPMRFDEDSRSMMEENCPFLVPGISYMEGVPITNPSGEVVGAIAISKSEKRTHCKDQDTIFRIFASRAAAEFSRLESDRAREAELDKTRMLLQISRAISQRIDRDEMLDHAVQQIGKVFHSSRCLIHRTGEDGCPIITEWQAPRVASPTKTEPCSEENAFFQDVLNRDECEAVDDVQAEPRLADVVDYLEENHVMSLMAARTSYEGHANGMVVLHQTGTGRNWTQAEKELLEGVASQIGVAIAQVQFAEREKEQREAMEKSRLKAEAASRAKGEFLARMSHELRTPMNAILGFSQLLSSDTALTEKQQGTLAIINRSGEHLMALINDVLEMSKIEAGKSEVNRSIFNPKELVENLCSLFHVRAETKGLELIVELPDDMPTAVESDESKLRQILTNLLSNAVKFTTEGHVHLKGWYFCGKDAGENSLLAFRVGDSGCGIAPEEQEKLFNPFVQTASGIHSQEGTGLGLTITQSFVELLHGQIRLESVPQQGTEISFWIPIREVEDNGEVPEFTAQIATHRSTSSDSDPTRPLVMVADDQPENRLLVVQFLKGLGIRVVEAVDGQDAIDIFRERNPSAILMDVRMPGTDGLAATGTIRNLCDEHNRPVIIALTGNAFEDDRKKALAAGCDDFLAKPFRLDDLKNKLSTALGISFHNRSATATVSSS